MDIMSALTAGTKALEALKAIQEIDKSYDAAAWKAKVAELMSDIADMKMALIEANDKIRLLETQTEALSAQVKFKVERTVTERNGFVYEVFDGGSVADLPFCQNCTTGGKYVRIVRTPGNTALCPACKTHFDMRSVLHGCQKREA